MQGPEVAFWAFEVKFDVFCSFWEAKFDPVGFVVFFIKTQPTD